jgi:hypothetical protein
LLNIGEKQIAVIPIKIKSQIIMDRLPGSFAFLKDLWIDALDFFDLGCFLFAMTRC